MSPVRKPETPAKSIKRRIGRGPRRELIVQSALEVFAELGYHAASVDQIAARAGITKTVLYDHFKSKAALHLFLLKLERDQLLEHVEQTLGTAGTQTPGVADALDAFYGWAETHPYAWRMLFRETTGDPKVAKAHRKIQAEAHRAVIDLLVAGYEDNLRSAGSIEETKQALAALIGGATHGLVRWWYDNPDVPREHVVALTMDLLWHGLDRVRQGRLWARSDTDD